MNTETIEKISKDAQIIKFERHSPTKTELNIILSIILDFVKKNNRKIYGGAAIHYLLKSKKEKGLYLDKPEVSDDVFDIDFYSITPKEDLHYLCDAIFNKGLKWVSGADAGHEETFSVQYHHMRLCDITFAPPNVYGIIPTVKYDGLTVCDAKFIMVDMYRMRSNPSNSFFRLTKFWERQEMLLKHFPEFSREKACKHMTNKKEIPAEIMDIVNNENVFPIGTFALNLYIDFAGKPIKYFPERFLELVSLDVKDTMKLLQEKLVDKETKWTEFSPLYQLYGGSVELRVKSGDKWVIWAKIYDYRKRCVPFFVHNNIQVPSFDYLVCCWYFEWVRQLSMKKDGQVAQCAIGTMHYLRNQYLKKHKLGESSKDHPFQILRIDCKGDDIDFLVETSMRRHENKMKKRPIVYRYQPLATGITKAPPFYYVNSTGREVHGDRYKQFIEPEKSSEMDVDLSKEEQIVEEKDIVEEKEKEKEIDDNSTEKDSIYSDLDVPS